MNYVYHHYAIAQPEPGKSVHMDGVITREYPIADYHDYLKVKKIIARDAGFDFEKVTICSLTLLAPTFR